MSKYAALAVLGSLLLLGGPAVAEIGTSDVVPAATLLIPRFEVALDDLQDGITTLFAVNNASAAPVIAHVTIWSEYSIPVLDFDIYLTGYDIELVNLRDIIGFGDLPQTGPSNTLSPLGDYSVGFPVTHNFFGGTCSAAAGGIPNYAPLSAIFLQVVQESLTGQPLSAGLSAGLCASRPGNSTLARGYLTIDAAQECSQLFPNSPGYFVDGGLGVATDDNVLWGDYFIVDTGDASAQGNPMVHIEADPTGLAVAAGSCDDTDFQPTTFYCRYTSDQLIPGADNREALASVWGSRFDANPNINAQTDLLVYRDTNGDHSPASCAGLGPFGNLTQSFIIEFDLEEQPFIPVTGGASGEPTQAGTDPFPLETNRRIVGDSLLPNNFDNGWYLLNLNEALQVGNGIHNQAYVTTVLSGLGDFSVGWDAVQLNNLTLGANNPIGTNPTILDIDANN